MNGLSDDPQQRRAIKRAELEGRKYQKSALALELDHFIQTHQATTAVAEQIKTIEAEIARLEEELRNS